MGRQALVMVLTAVAGCARATMPVPDDLENKRARDDAELAIVVALVRATHQHACRG